jgi:hypothetical protein
VARLVSESLDRPLTFRERLAVRFHIMMCGACTRYRRQLAALTGILRARVARGIFVPASEEVLSPQAQQHIVNSLPAKPPTDAD